MGRTQKLELPRMNSGTPKPPKQQVAVAFTVPSLTWAKATKKGRTSDARLSAGLRQTFNPNQCLLVYVSMLVCFSLHYHHNIHEITSGKYHGRVCQDTHEARRTKQQLPGLRSSLRACCLYHSPAVPPAKVTIYTITAHAFRMTNKFTNHQSTRSLSIRANRQRLTSNCVWPKHWWSRNTGDCSPAASASATRLNMLKNV